MLRQLPWLRPGFQGYWQAFGGLPSIMWKWKDNPIVLHTACLASHQADVSGMQQHSWQSGSRWWTQNGSVTVSVCCPIPEKQHEWLGTSIQPASTVASNLPNTGWCRSGHVSITTRSSTPSKQAYNHYALSFFRWHTCCHSLPFHLARFLCGDTRGSYMSCALVNIFQRSVFSCLFPPTPFGACHLFVI